MGVFEEMVARGNGGRGVGTYGIVHTGQVALAESSALVCVVQLGLICATLVGRELSGHLVGG